MHTVVWVYLYSFGRCWIPNLRNSDTVQTYSRSRSSEVIDVCAPKAANGYGLTSVVFGGGGLRLAPLSVDPNFLMMFLPFYYYFFSSGTSKFRHSLRKASVPQTPYRALPLNSTGGLPSPDPSLRILNTPLGLTAF